MYTLWWYNSHIPQCHCVVVCRGVAREIQILLAVHITTYADIWNTFSLSPLSLASYPGPCLGTRLLSLSLSHQIHTFSRFHYWSSRQKQVGVCVCEREREREKEREWGRGGGEKEFVCVCVCEFCVICWYQYFRQKYVLEEEGAKPEKSRSS